MDGTFLGADGIPSQANCDAVLAAADLGVPTIFATGRPARWLQPLDLVRAAYPAAITSNGAMVIDLARDEILHVFPLDTAVTADVIHDVRSALPEARFAVEYVMGWGREQGYPPHWHQDADIILPEAEDLLSHGTVVKLLIRCELPTSELMARVAPAISDRLTVTFSVDSDFGFLEVSPPGITKASTLSVVLGEMGISPADTAGFGDMPNDLAMLDLVGHPFVMDNAHPMLKQRGYPVCGHHADSAFATTVADLLGLSVAR